MMGKLSVPCTVLAVLWAYSGLALQAQTRTMTLQEMFACADSLNSSVRAADYAVEESAAGVEAARNASLPSIGLSVSMSAIGLGYSFDRKFGNAVNEQLPGFGNNLSLEASQVVYAGGAVRNGIRAAELGLGLAEVQSEARHSEMHYLIVCSSLEILKLRNQLKVLDANIALAEKVLEQMRGRFDEGTVLKNDIMRCEMLRKDLDFQRISLSGALGVLQKRLAMQLGFDDGCLVSPEMELDAVLPEYGAEYWIASASENSSSLKGAELAVDLGDARLGIAKAERRPSVVLYAANTLNGPDVTTFISGKMAGYGLLDKNFNYATVGVGISFNLDNLYKSGSKIRQSRAALAKSREELEAVRRETELALNALVIEYEDACEQYEICTSAVGLARENYSIMSSRYEGGLATMTDLLDASSRKLDSEMAQTAARIDILNNYYRLLYISGTL
ncbi:MAG: TolC family protein [Candidatus Cryptobacteroides sp.]